MKRTTIKQMKETGWYDFVQWAIKEGYRVQNLDSTILSWNNRLATLRLCNAINEDMFNSVYIGPRKICGLSKQVSNK